MKKLLVLAGLVMLLTGCGRTELNELDVVSALGIDQTENGLLVSIQIVNPGGTAAATGKTPEAPVYTFSYEGTSLTEIMENVKSSFSRKFFFSHLSLVVLGDEFAQKTGFLPITDFIERQYQIKDNVPLLIAENSKAVQILKTYTPVQKIPAIAIKDRVYNNKTAMGLKKGTEYRDLAQSLSEYQDPVVLGVKKKVPASDAEQSEILNNINGNEKAFEIMNVGAFKGTKLVDWLKLDESRGWALASGYAGGPVYLTVPCPDDSKGMAGVMLKKIKGGLKLEKGSSPLKYKASVEAKGMISEITCNIPIENPETIQQLNKETERVLTANLLAAMAKSKSIGSDYLGLQKLLYQNDYFRWKKSKDNWEQLFQNAQLETEVKVNIKTAGTRVKSIYEDKQTRGSH
ncbi:Ger(x)C family spore germination protein [Metabacillus sp. GX 13764]|uniref:Ger(x)C family spore germination protein n=1 Tax=Metabacillus kandeliae TaxID=2900151 RepID=UPI001E4CC171|nr:Ger(x)C family spore germination protein [Metabacillus kandeliae]MCD7032918.1 Ger(x)C family spore germination protein [Metabacillus kandeliae]